MKKDSIRNIHDKFFKESFNRKEVASIDTKQEDKLRVEIEKSIKDGGAIMPTIAEKWKIEGKIEGKIEDAEKMIEKEMTNEDIRDITGLSIKKIVELRKKLGKE